MKLYGCIETGGTKTKCAVASAESCTMEGKLRPKILRQTEFATTKPEETMQQITGYLQQQEQAFNTQLEAIGIACFGPIDPDPASPSFGYITTTPKQHWAQYNFVGALQQVFQVPIYWDTDVNAPALAEQLWGAAQGCDPVVYITVGTGLGGGAVVHGKPLHGLMHPEMGHILVRSHEQDAFSGCCPYHSYCLEGMASGTAIAQRWACSATALGKEHLAWEMESYYLAQGLLSYILTLSPQKIIMGGGVMQQQFLFARVRKQLQELLHGYIQVAELLEPEQLEGYIVPPAFGSEAGLYGALALACSLTASNE